jgi:Lhr-like helicase
MTGAKSMGIWMDHSNAHLMAFTNPIETTIISSKFTHQEKTEILNKGESHKNNKEQHEQADYYKQLAAEIIQYKEVLLFGPTDAKTELFNILKADNRFADIKIVVKETDRMTENQEHAFVKKHLSKHF